MDCLRCIRCRWLCYSAACEFWHVVLHRWIRKQTFLYKCNNRMLLEHIIERNLGVDSVKREWETNYCSNWFPFPVNRNVKKKKKEQQQQKIDYKGANCRVPWDLKIGASVTDMKETGLLVGLMPCSHSIWALTAKAAVFLCSGDFPELVFPLKKSCQSWLCQRNYTLIFNIS